MHLWAKKKREKLVSQYTVETWLQLNPFADKFELQLNPCAVEICAVETCMRLKVLAVVITAVETIAVETVCSWNVPAVECGLQLKRPRTESHVEKRVGRLFT